MDAKYSLKNLTCGLGVLNCCHILINNHPVTSVALDILVSGQTTEHVALKSFIFCAGAIAKTERNKQVLDKLQVERERGITVKAQTASLFYQHEGQTYLLNLIDTPVSIKQLAIHSSRTLERILLGHTVYAELMTL